MEREPSHDRTPEPERPLTQKEKYRQQLKEELDTMFGEGYTDQLIEKEPDEYLLEWIWFLTEHDPEEASRYGDVIPPSRSMIYGF